MEIKCPCCKAKLTLEHIVLDQVRSDLFRIIFSHSKQFEVAIVSYLALWRMEVEIRSDKALRLVKEVLAMPYSSIDNLTTALEITIDSLRQKETFRPLTNHEYLTKVLVSVEERSSGQVQRLQHAPAAPQRQASQPKSKADAALMAMENLRGEYGEE